MPIVTREKDRGYQAVLREIKKIQRQPHVAVGMQGREGEAIHPSDNSVTVAQVATFNEFGTKNIPERSFIRSTMDENVRPLLKDNERLFYLIAAGKTTTEKALNTLGLKIVSLIKKKITDLRSPPNDPKTVARKKSSNPLIDTGVMRQSVTHKVKRGGDAA